MIASTVTLPIRAYRREGCRNVDMQGLRSVWQGLSIVFALLLCSVSCSSAANGSIAVDGRGLRHPIPSHIMKWNDKLDVQKWLDAVREEITKKGTVPIDSNCDAQFGQGYLDKWKAAKKDVCKPGGKSTYSCYAHPPSSRGNNVGSMFCTATNLILDSADFIGDIMTNPAARFPNPKKGSARVACSLPDPLPWTRQQVADQHTDRWLYDALTAAPADEVEATCSDPRRTVPHPVYFMTRMDTTNAFHHFEEIVNFFAALWLFPDKQLLQQGIAVVMFDGHPPGFYLELWRRAAYPYRIRFLRSRPYPPGTCFKHVLLASMPHRSLYTHFWPGMQTSCRSLVFSAVMGWAHALMADTRPESYTWPDGQHRQNEDTVVGRVTWVSRRHFEAANKGRMNSWQMQRMLNNEDAVVPALSAAVTQWNARSCLRQPGAADCRRLPVYFEFGTMELGDHRWYPEQLSTLSRTNVLMAVHGAGVFNEVWLRPATSSVIEVMHNAGGNYHYRNIAAFLGLPYSDMGSAHDPAQLAAKLTEVMDETARRMAAEHQRKRAAEKAAAERDA
ncbi:hypothetical protein Agub_g9361 [Astrephomene gubernaculifera]|uniref:Uncharacterized protein n=1 Tax=Astrephomene gubernaculifera TaxID=47775 RepID=A0AAD3DVV6_9CHLO|nr:hypothetical protein Agub_g9361 [Astrephomene gubernaculifera]